MNRLLSPLSRLYPHALLLLASTVAATGCGDSADFNAADPTTLYVNVSQAIPTVVNISWTTNLPSAGYVEYGPTPEMEFTTSMGDPSLGQSVNLVGLTPSTVYHYRVVTWSGKEAGASPRSTFQTGVLPGGIPPMSTQVFAEGHTQFTLVPLTSTSTVVIIDPQGNVVWSAAETSGLSVYRALRSVDGTSVLYNAVGPLGAPAQNSSLVQVALDGSFTQATPVPWLGTDFVQHMNGTLAALVSDPVAGDKIVEVVGGVVTDVWSAADCFDASLVTGANALDYVESEQAYYVSLGAIHSIAKVNRATRACDWVLNGTTTTPPFAHPHQFQVFNTGELHVLLMDNDGTGGLNSRVLDFVLDPTTLAATLTWEFSAYPPVYSPTLGEPVRIAGGDTFINWSAGQLQRVDAMNQTVWQLNAPGVAFGYHTLLSRL